ncbi:GNAT family N-acetyltransferase [Paenibacillus sanguinis]|uniref:GNAT family N-acetyltransferase n=1 Tax=Paenibacillus sanguinis TaxID=225906 RepID=UPI0003720A75|nr:GNAT family N-acetyltransferase [Paenibacillus sanguinis]
MEIRPFSAADIAEVVKLWNREATKYDYKPMDERQFSETFLHHPYYDAQAIWVGYEATEIVGFAAGCIGDDLPLGEMTGYITSVIIDRSVAAIELYDAFVSLLETRFRERGKKQADILFFNPVRLKWSIPGTPGHEHNNAPGIGKEQPLYGALLARGYEDRATQCGMYLQLGDFVIPQDLLAKEVKAGEKGYSITTYDPTRHTGLKNTLVALQNSQWEQEVVAYARDGAALIVAIHGSEVVGFAGPIIVEPSGRAFFSGIGVHPGSEGHGLGSVLFFRMVEAFQQAGCRYITLFTGSQNPALRIYEKAGFATVKTFSILRRELNHG